MASASTRTSGLQLLLVLHPCSLWQPKAMTGAPHCSTAHCSSPPTGRAAPEIPQYSQEQKQKTKYYAVNKSKQNNQNYSRLRIWEFWKARITCLLQASRQLWGAWESNFSVLKALSHPLNAHSTGCCQNCSATPKYLPALPVLVIFT